MKTLKILMLEDNPIDARIIQKHLSNQGLPFICTVVDNGPDYLTALSKGDIDLILSDHQLPGFDSIQALKARNRLNTMIPFILITGTMSEQFALSMLKEGADDYILKDRLQRLPFAIRGALGKQQQEGKKLFMEHSLAQLTQRFQLAARVSFDVIWDFDLVSNNIYCSDALEKMLGISGNRDFDPSYLFSFIHPQDRKAVDEGFRKMVEGKDYRWRKLYRMIKKDGTTVYINNNAMVIRDEREKAVRVLGVMQDVTEIRRLQHELMVQERKKQKQIMETTIIAQEKERSEIGKELHDNVNQLLATAKIMIDTARAFPEMHDICLSKSQETILDAINELRNLSHNMMSPMFDKHDLNECVEDMVHKLNLTGNLNITLNLPPREVVKNMYGQVKLAFYRMIQEHLSNVLKHAQAKNVHIVLELINNDFQLTIIDDGKGFDTLKKSKGIGLTNMESRAGMINGSLRIISSPGQGCTLKVLVPSGYGVEEQVAGGTRNMDL